MDFYGFYDLNEEDNFVQSFIGDTSVFGRSYEEPEPSTRSVHLVNHHNNHNNGNHHNNNGHGHSSFGRADSLAGSNNNNNNNGRSSSSSADDRSSPVSSWESSGGHDNEEAVSPLLYGGLQTSSSSCASSSATSMGSGMFASLDSLIPTSMSVVDSGDHELSFFETSMPSAALGRPTLAHLSLTSSPAPTTYFHSPVDDEGEGEGGVEDLSSQLEAKLTRGFGEGLSSSSASSLSSQHRRKRKSLGPKFRSKSSELLNEHTVAYDKGISLQIPLPPLSKGKAQQQTQQQQVFRFDGGVGHNHGSSTYQETPGQLEIPLKVKQEFPLVPVKLEPTSSAVELVVERQPPVEVRTRTPSENRNFGVTVRVGGDFERLNLESIEVRLAYAACDEPVKQAILGGRKVVSVKEDGRAVFDNLSMREASTKHGEKEFCLEFLPLTRDGKVLGNFGVRTNPFYAYSHMKVLTRRKCVKLRTLNKNYGTARGGEKMHVIGQPFIRGPSLSIVFSTPHGDVYAPHTELYSDSVLFFELPPYPDPSVFSAFNPQRVTEIKVKVQVTNDGRAFSNPLDFTYLADSALHPMDYRA